MITEEQGNRLASRRQNVRAIKILAPIQRAVAPPVKSHLQRAAQDTLVRCRPGESLLGGEAQNFVGDASLAGPQTVRPLAKNPLMKHCRCAQLVARVLGMPEAVVR